MTDLAAWSQEQNVRCMKMVYAAMNALIIDLRGEGVFKHATREVLQRRAAEFIESKSEEPFSFLWMCYRLGADPNYIINAYKDGSINEWQPREWGTMTNTFLLKVA